MKKFLSEFLGTFMLVFCGTGAIIINQEAAGSITQAGIAITFGLTVAVLIYALGDISGAHFNPAVSIAFRLANKTKTPEMAFYIGSQITGAIMASVLLKLIFPFNELLGTTLPRGSEMQSFVLEFFLSFMLMFIILNVAHGAKEQGIMAGLAIGFTVLLEAMFAGPISGASMNPARSLAPALISGHTEHLWIYLSATIAGAGFAVLPWKYLRS